VRLSPGLPSQSGGRGAGTLETLGDMADSFAARFATARDRHGPLAIGADPHGQVLGEWGLTDDADGLSGSPTSCSARRSARSA
jgi:hypothetical protein